MLTRILKAFTLWYQRRVAVPIGSQHLMLDVGCGDKPHWRADVLADKYIGAEHNHQRNTDARVHAVAPLFDCSLEDLPFKDDSFDFVYCSHVLEHVPDPAAAVAELMRVGRAGYIEVPFSGIQKMYDQPSHLWLCDRDEEGLVFTAKEAPVYDRDIERFLNRGAFGPIAFVVNFFPDAAMIRMHWTRQKPIGVKVLGSPNLSLSNDLTEAATPDSRFSFWLFYRSIARLLFANRVRRKPVWFNNVVRAEFARCPDEQLDAKIYDLRFFERRARRIAVKGLA